MVIFLVINNRLPRFPLPLHRYFFISPESPPIPEMTPSSVVVGQRPPKLFAISFFVTTFSRRTQLILSPNFQTQEDMEMEVAAFESPPSPLSDDMSTLIYLSKN